MNIMSMSIFGTLLILLFLSMIVRRNHSKRNMVWNTVSLEWVQDQITRDGKKGW